MTEKNPLGMRLVIRQEGPYVNAYLAIADTMKDAVHLGSIRRPIAEEEPDLFHKWEELMTEAVARAAKATFGQTPQLIEQATPDHKRSGDA